MGLAQESDERLMQQVASGKREPLSILLRRYANPLLTFIRRMNGDHHHSEELFQDVFVAVWTGRGKYAYPRPFRSWLFGIAANKCRADFRRRQGSRPAVGPAVSLNDGVIAAVPAAVSAPEAQAIATETAELIETAVMRLPAQQRSVVVLKIWNDFSYADIAEMLELTESTVRSNMFHGLNALRKFLEPRMR